MNFGNIVGLVGGVSQVVYDHEVTGSAVTTLTTGSILNGDQDGNYTIITRVIGGTSTGFGVRLNNDSGTNYGRLGIYTGSPTSVNNIGSTGLTYLNFNATLPTNGVAYEIIHLYAKSGVVRVGSCYTITDALQLGTSGCVIYSGGTVWNNTADNITSIDFYGSTGGIGVGTRIIVLKSNDFTGGMITGDITTPSISKSWTRVKSSILGAATNSVTFTGLDGDTDTLYYITCAVKALGTGGTNDVKLTFNGDTGANYNVQYMAGQASTASANYYATTNYIDLASAVDVAYTSGNMILFAKSGYVRTALSNSIDTVKNTPTIDQIRFKGSYWNNTADNITSMTFTSYTGNNFEIGSIFEVYALSPGS